MKLILYIEDNAAIRENTVELLELLGHNIITAENGAEGLALVKEKLPDLILCDIQMPELDGYEVFKELKKDSAVSGIPFVFVTASAEKSEVEMGLRLGADGYIRKPFEEEELLDILKRHLQ